MAGGAFISVDIAKIADFEKKSEEVIKEFDDIKKKFEDINSDLLGKWEGEGADEYKKEVDHILENIGGIKDILDGINNGVVKDVKACYQQLDEDLGAFNRNPPTGEAAAG